MADTKISALTALTGAGTDTANDVLAIVDTSASQTKKIIVDELRIALMSNSAVSNILGGDVALNNVSNYFDGPSVSQGTSGTWFASGTVTLEDTVSIGPQFSVKLWDGTNTIASAVQSSSGANVPVSITLSGFITNPGANIRISVKDASATTGKILFNQSGNSKDSSLFAFRIG